MLRRAEEWIVLIMRFWRKPLNLEEVPKTVESAHLVAEAQLTPASATLPRPPTLKAVSPGSERIAARRWCIPTRRLWCLRTHNGKAVKPSLHCCPEPRRCARLRFAAPAISTKKAWFWPQPHLARPCDLHFVPLGPPGEGERPGCVGALNDR